MITMVTFLRGGIYSSLDVFQQLQAGSKLIATVNNEHDAGLVEDFEGTAIVVEPWDGKGGEWGRHEYVAGLWNKAIPTITTPLTLLMDDDIKPNNGSLETLLQGFSSPDFVATCAVYPYKEQVTHGFTACPVFYTDTMRASDFNLLPNKRDTVFTAGMGMSLWRTPVLKSCCPVEIHDRFGSPAGTEFDVGAKIQEAGKKICIDGRARCKHSTT